MTPHSAIFPRETEEMALTLALTDQTLLIWGEPGTGKEFLARFIHRRSYRAEKPLVIMELDELPRCVAMVHEWPKRWKSGSALPNAPDYRLLDATGGTLCISHVDDEDAWNQGILLSFLECPVFRDLTGEEFPLDFRIILLSDRNLQDGMKEKWFREDLFYRLSGFTLYLRPLRERRGEMRQIVASLMQAAGKSQYDREFDELGNQELENLCRYHWPGNIRELQSLLADATMFAGGRWNLERWFSTRHD
jgi:DNA-binding NtrC family response regulator